MTDINKWNNQVLAKQGVKHKAISPKVVRSVGDAKRATLHDGTVVKRTDAIWVDGYGLISCAPYELHFIYQLPKHMNGWGLMCTCGSIAGVVGYAAYSKLAAPTATGHIVACVRHTATRNNVGVGKHADESTE